MKLKDLPKDIQAKARAKHPELKKENKYHNKITYSSGIRFHSAKEARCYEDFSWQERMGIISDLKLQPKFKLIVNDITICEYWGDFEFFERPRHSLKPPVHKVVDVKGCKTPEYIIKAKLFRALYPHIEFIEI